MLKPVEIHNLRIAFDTDDVERTISIIKENPELIIQEIMGRKTPLYLAAEKGMTEIVKAILVISQDPEMVNKKIYSRSALFIASMNGHTEVVIALLLVPGIEVEAKKSQSGLTAHEMATCPDIQALFKQKILLMKLSQEDLNRLANDPSVHSPLIIKNKNEIVEDDSTFPTYSQYLMTLRKIPTDEDFDNYLIALVEARVTSKSKITTPERDQVIARKLWTDVVTDIDRLNEIDKQSRNLKKEIIDRLYSLGYTNNTEQLYQTCLELLNENSAIVVTFNASFLKKQELSHYQLQNLFEYASDPRTRGCFYKPRRDVTEKELLQFIDPVLYEKFFNNNSARPRYGALILFDNNQPIEAIADYGQSYFVLDKTMKYNALFNYCDSMDAKFDHHREIKTCTYHHFEFLLAYCKDFLLTALAEKALTGSYPVDYSQQYGSEGGGYIEVMLPAINLLDASFVKHFHFHPDEYQLTEKDLENLSSLGITVTNSLTHSYHLLSQQFMQYINCDNHEGVEKMLKSFPSLVHIANRSGKEPIHIAAKLGHREILFTLIKYDANPNKLTSNGFTPLHFAVQKGHHLLVNDLIGIKGINLNLRPYSPSTLSSMTPFWTAIHLANRGSQPHLDICSHFIRKGVDLTIPNCDGKLPLTMAVTFGNMGLVKLLVDSKKNIGINSLSGDGLTPLMQAVSARNFSITEMLLAAPGMTTINHKNNNGKSALYIAAEKGNIEIVTSLLLYPGIDLEAQCTKDDKKTCLQIAMQRSHKTIANLIEEKILLTAINKKLNLAWLANDPLVVSLFLNQKNKNNTANEDIEFPSYSNYLETKTTVSDETFLLYLKELKDHLFSHCQACTENIFSDNFDAVIESIFILWSQKYSEIIRFLSENESTLFIQQALNTLQVLNDQIFNYCHQKDYLTDKLKIQQLTHHLDFLMASFSGNGFNECVDLLKPVQVILEDLAAATEKQLDNNSKQSCFVM